uniref:gap junction beta-2 protein-like n=1 Tax=Myxine glutinosa TaxID=7769 RepID=UPI00358FFCEB
MDWGGLFDAINGISQYSTAIGRIWLFVIFLFRVLVLVIVGESIWGGDQSDFECNTRQPGCTNVCYDHFFPISHVRLWALQLIFVATPTMLVGMHVSSRYRRVKKKATKFVSYWHKRNAEVTNSKEVDKTNLCGESEKKKLGRIYGGLLLTYLLSITVRMALEVVFIYVYYALYHSHHMPRKLECDVSPCPQVVECFVARPTEKTILSVFMLSSSAICLFLNLIEFLYLFIKRCFFRGLEDIDTFMTTSRQNRLNSICRLDNL